MLHIKTLDYARDINMTTLHLRTIKFYIGRMVTGLEPEFSGFNRRVMLEI